MPSMLHEALVALFRNRPELAPEVLSKLLDVELPDYDEVKEESIDFTQIIPTEYRADLVVLMRKKTPVFATVVEVQLERDTDKRLSWPVYVTTLRARFNCPTCLLVVCPDASVAKWCATAIEMGHEGFELKPYVLGPEGVPVITDHAEAKASPEMAVISAMAHGADEEQGPEVAIAAFLAAAGLDDEQSAFYTDLILHAVGEAARRALEAMMTTGTYEYQSDFARKYFGKGKAEGEARGKAVVKAETIIQIIAHRLGTIEKSVRDRIRNIDNAETRDAWYNEALLATTPDEARRLADKIKSTID